MEADRSGYLHGVTQIEVWADIWCPFAHVGLRTVARRREQLGLHDVTMHVKAWPLELVNGRPLALSTTVDHMEALRRQVSAELFAGFDPDSFPRTTLPALALEAAAYDREDKVGEAVSFALRGALFEDGLDISDPGVLQDIAEAYGIRDVVPEDDQTVLAAWHEGEARGVEGSPHFFCGDIEAFCPSLDIATGDDGDLRIRRNMAALDEFLSECFKLD